MKITKSQLKQIIKEELEGVSGESVRSKLKAAIPEDYNIRNLAKDIAAIIKDDYGTHNTQLFLDTFNEQFNTMENTLKEDSFGIKLEEKVKPSPEVHEKASELRRKEGMPRAQSYATAKSMLKEDGHTDVPSARRKLKTTVEDAAQILQGLEQMQDEGELPSWWMGKITLAADYLNKARDYILVSGEQK